MKKEVLINIEGNQYVDNQKETITQSIEGLFYYKNEYYYLLFSHENIDNIIKFNKDKVSITKTGLNKTKMIIENHKINSCDYYTSHGVISLEIKGKYIDFTIDGIESCLKIEYELLTNGKKISKNTISIKIKEN